jgi:iron complex outermembrane recepter protein
MRAFLRTLLGASSMAVAGFLASAAMAQTAAPANPPQTVSDGDIIVTANRTESLASKTPVALTAISGANLRTAGITNPTTLGERVPNISIDRGDGLQITIRGITSSDNTEKGDPSAAFLSDGIYIARPQAQEVSFFDIDRVEVLRGPQGTLYGRNTTAGVVNLVTARPKHKFEASVDGAYGNYNTFQVTGILNVPVNDWIAVRAAINEDRRDNFISGPASINPFKQNISGRLSTLFDFASNVSLLLRGDYSLIQGSGVQAVSLQNFFVQPTAPAAGQRGTDPIYINGSTDQQRQLGFTPTVDPYRHNENYGVMADLSWGITDKLTLAYVGGYRKLIRNEIAPLFLGFTPGTQNAVQAKFVIPNSYQQDSQELRLAYNDGPLKAQAGFYYFHENQVIYPQIVGLISPTPGTVGYVFGFPQHAQARSYAGFGQATYTLIDGLRVTGGIRWTRDEKKRLGATVFHTDLFQPDSFPPDSLNDAELNASKITWRAGLDYDLNSRTLLYGSVATGYKSGAFNDGCSAGQPNCTAPLPDGALYYKPETLTAYEVGFKTRLAGNRLRLNGNYFHYDYVNLQVSQSSNICGGPCSVTTNAAKAKIDGVELEGNAAPTRADQFDFSVAWLNARYADYPIVAGVNLAGMKLDRSPSWVFGLGYRHTVSLANGATLAAGVHSKISASYGFLSTVLLAQFRQPAYTRTDLDLTYTAPAGRWYLQAFAKNLENKLILSGVSLSSSFPSLDGGTAVFQDPMTYGVRAGFHW